MQFENEIFELISHTGEARANIFSSLEEARIKNIKKSEDLMKIADDQMIEAHNMQTKLIQEDIQSGGIDVSLLMVHAQDHYMTSQLARDLVETLVEVFKYQGGK